MPPESAIKTKEKAGQERRVREILRQCKAGKIQLVRFLYCGNDGVIRGKRATRGS